jgi:microcystin-dependent protein
LATPYLGEIKLVSFGFAPKGWVPCNGQLMSISQNQALFSLLGTTYGGDGVNSFGLPNLQGATPIHMGSDANGNGYTLGALEGAKTVTLVTEQMPVHTHQAQAVSTVANEDSPGGNAWAKSTAEPYGQHAIVTMDPTGLTSPGASQAHNNQQPYLVLNFVIALQGIFPARN